MMSNVYILVMNLLWSETYLWYKIITILERLHLVNNMIYNDNHNNGLIATGNMASLGVWFRGNTNTVTI